MTDRDFWMTCRRAAIMVAKALYTRYKFAGLLIILTGEHIDTL